LVALVLGSAACLSADLSQARALLRIAGVGRPVIIAVNDAGWWYPGHLDHWATLHPENLPAWLRRRAPRNRPTTWSWKRDKDQPVDIILDKRYGSSGRFGANVARSLGADIIVLCGVPLDGRPRFFDPPDRAWSVAASYQLQWCSEDLVNELSDQVMVSMSGWTADRFGRLTLDVLSANTRTHKASSY
jgi:hypothetical protein